MPERAPQERPPLQVLPGAPAVDLRILQANERTLLAWLRTGLAIMAFGFVVGRLGSWVPGAAGDSALWSALSGAGFVAVGSLANALATVRFVRLRRAILDGEAVIPSNTAVLSLSVGLVLLGALLVVYLLAS